MMSDPGFGSGTKIVLTSLNLIELIPKNTDWIFAHAVSSYPT
jgi:hypothetical protein